MQEISKPPTFCEFADSTTLHGLNRATASTFHIARRLTWFVILLVMLGLYLFVSISSIIYYYRWESVTKITKTTKNELEFPSVSICFPNLFPRTLVESRPDLEFWMRYLETHPFWSLPDAMRANATGVLSTEPLTLAMLQNPQRLLERCEFGLEVFPCEERFTWQNSESTTCTTFMPEEHRARHGAPVTRHPGYAHGLNVWINLDTDNYFITATHGSGIKVVVHSHEEHPRDNDRGLAVAPGNEAYLAIAQQRIRNLPRPYSKKDCVKDEGRYYPKHGHMEPRARYSMGSCLLDCMVHLGVNDCDCDFEHPPFCTLAHYYACVHSSINRYFAECDCLYPCKYAEYDTTLTMLSLPTPSLLNVAIEWNLTHTTEEAIRKNVINLKIFFSDLQITKIKQYKAYTAYELISNLGGQMGLFLGASLISLGELIEFLLHACLYKFRDMIRRKSASVKVANSDRKGSIGKSISVVSVQEGIV